MKHIYALNYTLVIAKYSIYGSHLQGKKSLFKRKINIEREIAIAENKITTFNQINGIFLATFFSFLLLYILLPVISFLPFLLLLTCRLSV